MRRSLVRLLGAGIALTVVPAAEVDLLWAASDSHGGLKGRPANLGAARDAAAEIDQAYAEWLVTEAPAAILAGERLPPPPEKTPSQRRRIWPGRKRGL